MFQVLFVCTGNYYRSKFADIYFNHISNLNKNSKAISRGINIDLKNNIGNISGFAFNYLTELDINIPNVERAKSLVLKDVEQSDLIVGLDYDEHYKFLTSNFPFASNKMMFWKIPDLYKDDAKIALSKLKRKIDTDLLKYI
jgi:protein-tyrosine phosphatase